MIKPFDSRAMQRVQRVGKLTISLSAPALFSQIPRVQSMTESYQEEVKLGATVNWSKRTIKKTNCSELRLMHKPITDWSQMSRHRNNKASSSQHILLRKKHKKVRKSKKTSRWNEIILLLSLGCHPEGRHGSCRRINTASDSDRPSACTLVTEKEPTETSHTGTQLKKNRGCESIE